MKRRDFIASAGLFFTAFTLSPISLQAVWQEQLFRAIPFDIALKRTLGTDILIPSDKITIVAPPAASDSSSVDVEIISGIGGESIYLFVENNYTPLAFKCAISGKALACFATRIKMKESSSLIAIVSKGGSYYKAVARVEVSAEAC